nr:immunoglobulin heavy chain junction region [Macaca mulatta]MOW95759.1 immunoglobulin heavy chain junction region [Macaca mulatta]
CVTYSLDYW